MKPIPRSDFVTVIKTRRWWECSKPEHRHRTEVLASECIARTASREKEPNVWTPENLAKVLEQRAAPGATFSSLGLLYGVSGTQMRQVVMKAQRARDKGKL